MRKNRETPQQEEFEEPTNNLDSKVKLMTFLTKVLGTPNPFDQGCEPPEEIADIFYYRFMSWIESELKKVVNGTVDQDGVHEAPSFTPEEVEALKDLIYNQEERIEYVEERVAKRPRPTYDAGDEEWIEEEQQVVRVNPAHRPPVPPARPGTTPLTIKNPQRRSLSRSRLMPKYTDLSVKKPPTADSSQEAVKKNIMAPDPLLNEMPILDSRSVKAGMTFTIIDPTTVVDITPRDPNRPVDTAFPDGPVRVIRATQDGAEVQLLRNPQLKYAVTYENLRSMG